MTTFHCGSCSYEGSTLDDLRLHGRESGHPVPETAAAWQGPASTSRRFDGRTAAATVGTGIIGVLGIGAAVYFRRQHVATSSALARAIEVGAGLAGELAEKIAENDWLKSPSGAGATLRSFGK